MIKNLLKKVILLSAVLAFCMSWSITASPAAEPEILINPNNLIIARNTYSFKETYDGRLRCIASMTTSSNYEAELVVRLQIKDDRWRTTRTWTDNSGTITADVDEYYTPSSSGDYRLWVEYKAYDSSGNLAETVTDYSQVIQI